jgi:hypothetical protein
MYPVELIQKRGFATSINVLTLYFGMKDLHKSWVEKLQKATGSYIISDYYNIDYGRQFLLNSNGITVNLDSSRKILETLSDRIGSKF